MVSPSLYLILGTCPLSATLPCPALQRPAAAAPLIRRGQRARWRLPLRMDRSSMLAAVAPCWRCVVLTWQFLMWPRHEGWRVT